ncbi:MAG: 50S ribosomal protein L11 methyltransferase [Desulfovibrionales bacterium]|nr:50S ribosomal protein L11 methyltransferase [Desulfovibrionales bacterium]
MAWQEIIIISDADLTEALSDFLIDLTGRGICLEDLPASSSRTAPAAQRIKAYLPLDESYESKMASLNNYIESLKKIFLDSGPVSITSEIITGEDWAHAWKSFFKPMRLTERIVVKPSWEDFTAKKEDIVLEIDPGMAFGTGSHASTHLSLRALEGIILSSAFRKKFSKIKALDVGTGTGILGMAAAKLGAHRVLGVDIDPEAIKAASENVQKNALGDKMAVISRDLTEITEKFSIILANITYLELVRLCPLLFARLEEEGVLILSGILADQIWDLSNVYQRHGFSVLSTSREGEWVCAVLTSVHPETTVSGFTLSAVND